MKDYTSISRVYFIGIGGIGMSALARYYLQKKVVVSGYDKTFTSLTDRMEKEGAHIHYEDDIEMLDKQAQLVVYTPAVPKDHKELNYYLHFEYDVIKRSVLLGEITRPTFNICIGGTHGKTTISTMVAHILRDSGYGCTAFLGGISVNYDTNFWSSENKVSVVEADEYDRSFLKLSPDIALISAMDPDHLDIYGTKENMEESFVEFSKRVRPGGLLITKSGLSEKKFSSGNHVTYSLNSRAADVVASNITMENGSYQFDVVTKSWTLDKVQLNMGGMHNIENAVAAIFIANYLSIDPAKIKKAIREFKGVKRRFEYIIAPGVWKADARQKAFDKSGTDIVFIDDYAHHPGELNALIEGVKSLFPRLECTVIFQPHLFSRTKDLALEFAKSLDKANRVILLPIYPARELPIEGVTSKIILDLMENKNKVVMSKEELLTHLRDNFMKSNNKNHGKVLITAGAGDIDQLVQPIKEILFRQIKL